MSKWGTETASGYRIYGNCMDREIMEADEQARLVETYNANPSPEIMERLFVSNIRFVKFMVCKFIGRGVPEEDLMSMAYLGFGRAVEMFKAKFDKSFINYASYWIKASLRAGILSSKSLIRVPINLWKSLAILHRLTDERKSDDEIMAEMAINRTRLAALKRYRGSFDTDTYRIGCSLFEDNDLVYEVAEEDMEHKKMIEADNSEVLKRVVEEKLKGREKDIITKRYGLDRNSLPMTHNSIAALYKLSNERIRQIENVALRRLRKYVIMRKCWHSTD